MGWQMSAAEGQDQFQPVANRRAGYSGQLEWALKMARKGGCLGAGEGLLLVQYFEERLAYCERIFAALREPSEAVVEAVARAFYGAFYEGDQGDRLWAGCPDDSREWWLDAARAAVAAAEQETSTETPRD